MATTEHATDTIEIRRTFTAPVDAVYRAWTTPEALTWRWEDNPTMGDTVVTIELLPRGGATELVLTHQRLTDDKLREDHRYGWNGCLDRLAATLTN